MSAVNMSTLVSFSDFQEVTNVLMNTPLVSVGVLGIGLATFLIAMERMNRAILHILLATAVLFVASILDLFDILRSEGSSTSRSRSVGIAVALFLSAGSLRFFFLHRRSSQPGRYETVILVHEPKTTVEGAEKSADQPSPVHSRQSTVFYHSTASWSQWGTLGSFVRTILLAMIVVITVLDVVWRIQLYGGFRRFDTGAYHASAALQIAFLTLISLKLLDAARANPTRPRRRVYLEKVPLLIGNALGLCVAVASLAIVPFSETPLGRFLLGVQIFIYLIDTVIAELQRSVRDSFSFPAVPDTTAMSRMSSFVSIGGGSRIASTFRVSPPLPPPPADEMVQVSGVAAPVTRPGPVLRRGSRVPSWLGPTKRVSRRPSASSDRQPLTVAELEEGKQDEARSPTKHDEADRKTLRDHPQRNVSSALASYFDQQPPRRSPVSDIAPLRYFASRSTHRRDTSDATTSSSKTAVRPPPVTAPPVAEIPPPPISRDPSLRDRARRRATRSMPKRDAGKFDPITGLRLSSPLDLAYPATLQSMIDRERSPVDARAMRPAPVARKSSEALLDVRDSGSSGKSVYPATSRNLSFATESDDLDMAYFPSFPLPPDDEDHDAPRRPADSFLGFDSSPETTLVRHRDSVDPFRGPGGGRGTIVVGEDVFTLQPPRMPSAAGPTPHSSCPNSIASDGGDSVLGELTRFAGTRPVRNVTSFIAQSPQVAEVTEVGSATSSGSGGWSEPTTAELEGVIMRAARVMPPPSATTMRGTIGLPVSPRPSPCLDAPAMASTWSPASAIDSPVATARPSERPRLAPLVIDAVRSGENRSTSSSAGH